MKNIPKQPNVLVILDGFGLAKKSNANAITLAKTPTLDYLFKKYPNAVLQASGLAVGLPKGQAGNSEAGHLNIGAGRVVKQDLVDINDQIKDGRFFRNDALLDSLRYLEENPRSKVHVIGLLTGDQSSHTYPDHLYALLEFYKKNKIKNIYLHLFSDGRDAGQYDGESLMEKLLRVTKNGEIVSTLAGRYYGMDRNRNWDRTKAAYELITQGKSEFVAKDPFEVFSNHYKNGFTDEYIPPSIINNSKKKPAFVKDGDVLIFFNCRSERARQLIKPFVQKDFEKKGGFKRKKILKNLFVTTFTDFAEDLDHVHVAFPSVVLENTLPCAISSSGKTQIYIAESEKFAHITFFLNGGVGKTRCGEHRLKIPSLRVKSFINKPRMSAGKLTSTLLKLLNNDLYDFIAINYPNADILGHTGNIKATIKAIEYLDICLKKIYSNIIKKGGNLFIVGDHGNAEQMKDEKGLDTHHNNNPVPFIVVSKKNLNKKIIKDGKLSSVAPTVIDVMGIKKPKEMSSKSLFKK